MDFPRIDLSMDQTVIYEDEHILVVNKPPGWNTHAPSPFASVGLYEWLRDSSPERSTISIVHRLDKQTSGIIVFPKSDLARRRLTQEFMAGTVVKEYLLAVDKKPPQPRLVVESFVKKEKGRFVSERDGKEHEKAITEFTYLGEGKIGHYIRATPLTGRTHQIRLHAAQAGFPILGDTIYGGTAFHRLCLHASSLRFKHPATGTLISFSCETDFLIPGWVALRAALRNLYGHTNAFRLIHGISDGYEGLYVDMFGDVLLFCSATKPSADIANEIIKQASNLCEVGAVYWKPRDAFVQRACAEEVKPVKLFGKRNSAETVVIEHGVRYLVRMEEGYSVGLFLDQRDNRRRLLSGYIGSNFPPFDSRSSAKECLNLFSYTCSFSVCLASRGWRTVNVDISHRYLGWGQENFRLNGLNVQEHEFYRQDVWDILQWFNRKGRSFDLVIVDPPTFSRSKSSGVFSAKEHYHKLIEVAVKCVKKGGIMLACCNTVGWKPTEFLAAVGRGVHAAGRKICTRLYCSQPPDFPSTTGEPAYLKSLWMVIE